MRHGFLQVTSQSQSTQLVRKKQAWPLINRSFRHNEVEHTTDLDLKDDLENNDDSNDIKFQFIHNNNNVSINLILLLIFMIVFTFQQPSILIRSSIQCIPIVQSMKLIHQTLWTCLLI